LCLCVQVPLLFNRSIFLRTIRNVSDDSPVLLSLGTLVLFLGDMEFGVYRFRKPITMYFGPYFYLGGQLLIAVSLSCGAMP